MAKEESMMGSLECINAQFNISFANAKSDSLAFVFGVKESLNIADGCYAVVMEASKVKIGAYENGEFTALAEGTKHLTAKAGVKLKAIVNKDGTVSVYSGKEKIVETTIDVEDYYVGYLGFASLENNSGKIMIDELNIITSKYHVPVTKSVTHNFSSDYFGNKGYEDFIYNQIPENSLYVKDGKLVWDGASDYTFFGSAYEYDDFVLDFKICSILASEKRDDNTATAKDKWIGIDIGKKRKSETEYGSHLMFGFQVTPTADTVSLWPYTSSASLVDTDELAKTYKVYETIPASLFEAIQYDNVTKRESDVLEKDTICVRFVAEKGTIKLYMKKACEAKFTLYYSYDNVDTTGYVSLCCTGFLFVKMDDFSMSNISDLYICADSYVPETIVKPGKDNIIYDRGNVDMNGLDETKLNAASCSSYVDASYCVLPILAVASLLVSKQKKGRDDK